MSLIYNSMVKQWLILHQRTSTKNEKRVHFEASCSTDIGLSTTNHPSQDTFLENWSGSSTSGLPFRSLGMTPNLELQGAISPSETNNPQRLIWDLHCSKSNYTAALASKCAGYSGSMLWGGKQCSINQFLSYKLSRQHQQFIVNMCCQIEPTQQRAHVMPPTHKGG